MQPDWQTFITSQSSLEHQQLPTRAVVPLDKLTVILITGEETTSFLQNLLTNDVQALQAGEAQLNGFCNPKGRLLAQFLLVRTADGFQLILPECQADFISQRLGMFKLRAKVEIAVTELRVTGIQGETPQNCVMLPYDQSRAIHIDETQAIADWIQQQLDAGNELSTVAAWHYADSNAGIGQIYQSSREMFTPQQINFDLNGGVSFKKGCFPGQEVVARLHYLGKPNRRLFSGVVNGSPVPGEEVFNDSDKVAGHIYDVATTENGMQALISLKLADKDKTLHLAQGETFSGLQALAPETD